MSTPVTDWTQKIQDIEQIVRYFRRRDEMNAETHLQDAPEASVRYSPITAAAERVMGWLWVERYGGEAPTDTRL